VCFSTAAALQHTSPWDSMVVLLMQGVVSRGERRKAMEGGRGRIKKMIERKGGLEREELMRKRKRKVVLCVMGRVASSRGSKPQRPHPPKATDDEIYADDGTHRSTRRIERKNRTQDQESEVSMRDHGLQVSSNKAQHAPRTRRRDGDERQHGSRRTKARFSQMHVFNCGAELIFDLRDKFTCCQWAASMQELQFLCYPHNSRGGGGSWREGMMVEKMRLR
jgi:hypothetical protein